MNEETLGLDPKKISKIQKMLGHVKNMEDISEKDVKKVMDMLLKENKEDKDVKKVKVGRNQKCTCGSMLKWKKCCGKN